MQLCVRVRMILCVFELLVLAGCCLRFFSTLYKDQNRGKTTTAALNRLALTITATNYGCLTWSSHYVLRATNDTVAIVKADYTRPQIPTC